MSKNGGKRVDSNYLDFMETLEEAVLDQSELVTYKWLCHELKTTANIAKQMLFAFVESQKKNGTNLHVTYLLAGTRMKHDDMGHLFHSVAIVASSKLDIQKSKFSRITSIHVYSVQKIAISDTDALYSVDYDLASNLDIKKASAIVCPAATMRISIGKSVDIANSIQKPPEKPFKPEMGALAEDTSDKCNGAPNNNKQQEKKRHGALSSMFATMAAKERSAIKKNSPESTANDAVTGASLDKDSVNGKASRDSDGEQKSVGSADNKLSLKVHDKRKKSKIDNLDRPKKRLRRIIEMSDSSSDDDIHGESEDPIPSQQTLESDSEDPIPPSQESEPRTNESTAESSQSTELHQRNNDRSSSQRGRRLIEETVQDEDGYLSTQKKWVECSDGESDCEQKTSPPKVNECKEATTATTRSKVVHKKQQTPVLNKQAMLTSFFKRK